MSYKDLLDIAWQGYVGKSSRASHHPRKRGPGRFNKLRAYSRKFVSDAHFDSSGNRKRLSPASGTGNWQGLKYESYAHADARTRARLTAASQQPTSSRENNHD